MKTMYARVAGMGICSALLVGASAWPAAGQVSDALLKAKALYAEASYEDALKTLDGRESPEAYQYRALCLIALGRNQDAERAIETLIQTAPMFTVSDAELPPRLVSLFTHTRQRVMPAVVRQLFAEAREDFQAKELDRAGKKFEQVLALLHDSSMAGAPDTKDLEILTTGYLDIVKNAPPPPPLATKTKAAPLAAAPSPVSPRVPAPAPPRPVVITPAVTIRQTVPPFTGAINAAQGPRTGSIRIVIGVDGKVKSAKTEEPLEPRYDARLRAEAMTWLYEPAKRGNQPIQSEKVVSVTVGQAADSN
jgi:hypothetical protein